MHSMSMHATPWEGAFQQALIRKALFVVQYRQEAGRTEIFACPDRALVAFFSKEAVSV